MKPKHRLIALRFPDDLPEEEPLVMIPHALFDQGWEALNHLLYANHKPCLGCDGCNNARTTLAAMEATHEL